MIFNRGIFVPEIKKDACINCGLCLEVCPSAQIDVSSIFGDLDLFTESEKECYIAFSNYEDLRRAGTSGGVISTIIYELLSKSIYDNAYVLDYERFDGEQAIIRPIRQPKDVVKSAKSKYIPASIAKVVSDIISGTIGKSIVVATPCQLLAIKKCYKIKNRREDDVLFIGLFCDKTLNYNIYGYYREKYGEFDSFHFRDKEGNGWPGDTVLYNNGEKTIIDKQVRMSLKPYFQLNRCRYCFDKLNQLADISCGDCYIKGEDSEAGKSSIIIRTTKGRLAINESSSHLILQESCFSSIKNSQHLENKLENYLRNNISGSPFIIPESQLEIDVVQSKDLELLRLGERASNTRGYKRIDKRLSMENIRPANKRIRRYLNRLLKIFYNPDRSIKVLIDNAGFTNKGAALMLQSIVQQLITIAPKVNIIVPQKVFYENLDYCHRHNILPLSVEYGRKSKVKCFLYKNILNKPWYITPDQIDLVLDAGGFQFGDQWSASNEDIAKKNKYYSSFTKAKRMSVFLPQAFGPFEQPLSRQLMEVIYNISDVLYAREPESFNHLKSLFPNGDKIKLSPDFTCLSKSSDHVSIDLPNDYVVLIPNVRMVTHTMQDVSDHYFDFLQVVSEFLIRNGEFLVLLNHEGSDDLNLLLKLNNISFSWCSQRINSRGSHTLY